MGHIRNNSLKYLSNQRLLGKDIIEPLDFCETCVLGKSQKVGSKAGSHTTKRPLDCSFRHMGTRVIPPLVGIDSSYL